MTFAFLPSMTATHELVVPRSIPMSLSHGPHILLVAAGWSGPDGAPDEPPSVQILAICDGVPSYRREGWACKDRHATLAHEKPDV